MKLCAYFAIFFLGDLGVNLQLYKLSNLTHLCNQRCLPDWNTFFSMSGIFLTRRRVPLCRGLPTRGKTRFLTALVTFEICGVGTLYSTVKKEEEKKQICENGPTELVQKAIARNKFFLIPKRADRKTPGPNTK